MKKRENKAHELPRIFGFGLSLFGFIRVNSRTLFIALAAICSLLTVPCHAQDRSRLAVYVPMPTGGAGNQRAYFQNNFKMELVGANYPVVETRAESMYTLSLDIQDNPDFDSRQPVTDENNSYFLAIKLERSNDNAEIVSFSFPFNDIESMSAWNLYLLYQALANAYVPGYVLESKPGETVYVDRLVPSAADDRWRNQTFYLNLGLGADAGSYRQKDSGRLDKGFFIPSGLAGLEWHFHNVLSVELDAKARFLDDGDRYIPALGLSPLIKGVFNVSTMMLEPYGGAEVTLGFGGNVPLFSALGGVQIGFQGGAQSAWVVDVGLTGSFGTFTAADQKDYDVLRLHVLAGYKFGFQDRPPRQTTPPAETAAP